MCSSRARAASLDSGTRQQVREYGLLVWSVCAPQWFATHSSETYGVDLAGNGVSHPVHMERFGIPGKTLLGSDSHTCAAGSLGMLAIGTGGLYVAAGLFLLRYLRVWLVVG
jgi:homoaconitase/3-isopropylmalate dehydratase large subunit